MPCQFCVTQDICPIGIPVDVHSCFSSPSSVKMQNCLFTVLLVLYRVRTRVVVVLTQPDCLYSCAQISSVMLAKVQWQRLAQLPCFCGGWSKEMYLSNTFCSSCPFLFSKSHSFVYWMKLLKIPFCVICCDLLINHLYPWNESKHAAVIQCYRPSSSLATEETTPLHSHTKTTIKSPNGTQNIVWPIPTVASYTEKKLQLLSLHTTWK